MLLFIPRSLCALKRAAADSHYFQSAVKAGLATESWSLETLLANATASN